MIGLRVAVVSVLVAAGCGSKNGQGADAGDPMDPRHCSPLVAAVPYEGATHVPDGTTVTYKNNPPASGNHWPSPQPWGAYINQTIPRERWVHNLEHGGIVFLFNCPGVTDASSSGDGGAVSPCPEITNALQLLRDEVKPNQFNDVLIVITPDPLLPNKVAAVAWDYTLVSDHVDLAAFRCFRDARYDQGPEHVE